MKKIIFFIGVVSLLAFAACEKDSPVKADYDNIPANGDAPKGVVTGQLTGNYGDIAIIANCDVDSTALPILDKGICYSTTPSPTIAASTASTPNTNLSNYNPFTVQLSGLNLNTKYYYRSYSVNAKGVSYGEERNFTTVSALTRPTPYATSFANTTTAMAGWKATSGDGNPATWFRAQASSTVYVMAYWQDTGASNLQKLLTAPAIAVSNAADVLSWRIYVWGGPEAYKVYISTSPITASNVGTLTPVKSYSYPLGASGTAGNQGMLAVGAAYQGQTIYIAFLLTQTGNDTGFGITDFAVK